jgi:hypothetical protein
MIDPPRIDGPRHADLRITACRETGFLVWDGAEPIAAFSSRAEVADWIEQRLGSLPGEQEREAREFAAYQSAIGNVERFPNVAAPRVDPPPRRSRFFQR